MRGARLRLQPWVPIRMPKSSETAIIQKIIPPKKILREILRGNLCIREKQGEYEAKTENRTLLRTQKTLSKGQSVKY